MTVLVARGFAYSIPLWMGPPEGMVSTIAGLLVLAAAGSAWYLLRWQHLKGRTVTR